MSTAAQTKSVKKAKQRLTDLLKATQIDVADIVEDEAYNIYAEAVLLTPLREGTLEESVRVNISKNKAKPGINISASAKDPETGYDYAAIQHERMDFEHPIKGEAHYLSGPMERGYRRIVRKINKRLKEAAK